jgi:CRISPR system Cascade subunit CasD
MDCLMLRFDAPLMSFGAVVVDQKHPIWRYPGKSMLTGLLGNALGWDHGDTDRLLGLEARLRFAARWDAEPVPIQDYQTVDLGQDFLVDTGWTTRGKREDRGDSANSKKTHRRYRDYWANGVMTVALTLTGEESPTLDEIETTLRYPARPLFIGRKPCLPAAPILIGRRQAESLKAALEGEPLAEIGPRRRPRVIDALWPLDEGPGQGTEERYDRRDWRNNIHRGSERYAVGLLEVGS